MSLKEPTLKMSKSHPDPNSRILITDSQEEIEAKLKVALTDSVEGISYDPQSRPGVSNLIDILKHTTRPNESNEDIAMSFTGQSLKALKEYVAQAVTEELAPVRNKFLELQSNPILIEEEMFRGRRQASSVAGKTITGVRNHIGLQRL